MRVERHVHKRREFGTFDLRGGTKVSMGVRINFNLLSKAQLLRRMLMVICTAGVCLSVLRAQPRAGSSTVQSEGQREAQRFWSKYVAACGGSYYVRKAQGIFVELRGFHVSFNYDPITEADRLNGLQAKGSSQFTASSHRIYFNSAWHAWGDRIPEDMTLINSVRFQKAGGRWTFHGVGYFNEYAHPVTCSDVPGFRSAAKNEVPSNSVQIDDTHVFPIESFTIWESSSNEVANRFAPSATFIGWKIIYTGTAFNYKPPPVESYWYKDGVQWAYEGSAQFSNVGKGQLWASRGWQEPGHWEVGSYTVKIFVRKQLVAVGKFEIVAGDQLPKEILFEGIYKSDTGRDGTSWFRFYPDGTAVSLGIPKSYGDRYGDDAALRAASECLTRAEPPVRADGTKLFWAVGRYTIDGSHIEIHLEGTPLYRAGTLGYKSITGLTWANFSGDQGPPLTLRFLKGY